MGREIRQLKYNTGHFIMFSVITDIYNKKNFFSSPVAVNNSIMIGPLVFLL